MDTKLVRRQQTYRNRRQRSAPSHFIRNIVTEDVQARQESRPGAYSVSSGAEWLSCTSDTPNRSVSISAWRPNSAASAILRFDDTNPSKEEIEYVDSIKEDVRWLGFDWGDRNFTRRTILSSSISSRCN